MNDKHPSPALPLLIGPASGPAFLPQKDFKLQTRPVTVANHMWALFKEFLRFCRQEKKWWLIPLILLLLVLGAILLFTASSGIAWALYPFM